MLVLIMSMGTSTNAQSLLQVTEPAQVAGLYYTIEGAGSFDVTESITGAIVEFNDGSPADACTASTTDLTGSIVLIDSGECDMETKAANAAAAGAMAIILCNVDAANSNQIIPPGSGSGTTTIPFVGMSFDGCTTLRSATNVVATIIPSPNYLCAEALEITAGTYQVDSIFGDPVFGNQLGFGASAAAQAEGADFAVWYAFTPTTSGLVTINSCLGGADTRLKIWTGNCDVFGTESLVLVGDDDDSCPFLPDGTGSAFASAKTFYATAGTRYLIEWDDRWMLPNTSFSFNLFFEDMPFEPVVGEDCANATVIDPGTYIIDTLTGFGGNADNSLAAEWYSFTPAMDGIMTISSCNTSGPSEDTRVLVYNGACDDLTLVEEGDDDDDCGFFSIIGPRPVSAGTTYLIEWTDTWDAAGFDWELSLIDIPMIDVSMTVDMSVEGADPAGVFMAYGPSDASTANDLTVAPMTNNGDETWSVTVQVSAFDTIAYVFINGVPDVIAFSNVETVPAECGTATPLGVNVRTLATNSLEAIEVGKVCFSSCFSCEPEDCGNPLLLIDDNIETYTSGEVTDQAAHWAAWPGGAVGGTVTMEQAQDNQSILIDGASGTVDALLLLGDKTEGHHLLAFDMYIAAGNNAYFNLQHEMPTASAGFWAFDVYFDAGGTGRLELNDGRAPFAFNFPEDAWFTVHILVDIDNDIARIIVDDYTIAAWQFSTGVTNGGADFPSSGLNSINFYPADASVRYFVDNVVYTQIPAATEGNYCYMAVAATEGTNTTPELECFGGGYDLGGSDGAEQGYWFTWTAPEDGVLSISSCGGGVDTRGWIFSGADCLSLSTVGVNDDQCDLGDGNAWASYREAVVTGGQSYYIMWDNVWSSNGFDWELGFTAGAGEAGLFCQTATPIEIGGEYEITEFAGHASVTGPTIGTSSPGASVTPTSYVQSEWYTYTPSTNITATISSCETAASDTRVWVYTGDCSSFEGLTLVGTNDDGCGDESITTHLVLEMTAGTTYYIEWDDGNDTDNQIFAWTFNVDSAPMTEVTFTVDMSLVDAVSSEGVFISGPFNDWGNPGTAMTDSGNGLWTITLGLEEGATVEYKFQNGTDGWEDNFSTGTCGMNDNRFVVVGSAPMMLDAVCFNSCTACGPDAVIDPAFAAAISVFPNPTSEQAVLNYDFDTKVDLNIRIVNTLGQVMTTDLISNAISGTHRFDVSNFASGMYMIHITDGERLATQSLVVE